MTAPAKHTPRPDNSDLARLAAWEEGDPAWYRADPTLLDVWPGEHEAMRDLASILLAERAVTSDLLAALKAVVGASGWADDVSFDTSSERERSTTLWKVARLARAAIRRAAVAEQQEGEGGQP